MSATPREHRLHQDVGLIETIYDAAPIGVAVWNVDGQLVHPNPVFCQLVGSEVDELRGCLFEELIHPQDTAGIIGKIADVWAGRRNYFECDLRCVSPDGAVLWLRTYLAPVYGASAEPEYLISHTFNFGGRGTRDSLLRQMANNSPVMLWLTDQEGRPRLGNRPCFEFLGVHQPSGELGQVWADAIHPDDMAAAARAIRGRVKARQPFDFMARSRRRDGSWRWLHHRANPIFDLGGAFEGYAGGSVDVTEGERARAELHESQRLFETLTEAGPVAVVRTDHDGRITYLNGRWAELIDDHEVRLPGFRWRDIVRSDDVDKIRELGIDSIRTGQPFALRVRSFERLRAGGGDGEFWGELRAAPVFGAGGEHTGFVATLIDASSEVAASARADRLARVLDASLDYVVIALPGGAITYANDAALQTFGPRVSPGAPDGASLWDLLDRESATLYHDVIEAALRDGGVWRGELVLRGADGREVPVSTQILAHNEAGAIESVSVVARDITEVRLAQEQLRHLATHDKLTGLANRALLYDRLDGALARAHRLGATAALMYCDLDNFKPVNDQYGHDAGDLVLVEIAARIGQVVRDTDTAARVGGDEFVVLVEGARDTQLVEIVAQRLLESICRPISIGEHEVQVTASIGLVIVPDGCQDADHLMGLADRAMYRAKAGGRRRVELHHPPTG